MAVLIMLAIIVAGLALFGAAALTFGVDSRYDSTDPRSPDRPVGIA